MTDKVYPDRTSNHYTYENTTSRLQTVTDAQGQSTNYTYFVDNNLQQVSYTNAVVATPSVSYTYDPNYNRVLIMTDGMGLTTYAYNAIVSPPALGAGQLSSIDGPLDNDTITYSYDELGRLSDCSVNGSANATSIQYDTIGRTQATTNPLGAFNYAYVNATGRLDHVNYPGGQKTQYAYFDNLGDQRLKQIKNLDPSTAAISQFDYTYDAVGNILTWTQANSGLANPQRYDLGYDACDQLRSAILTDNVTGAGVNQYDYDYDPAGNRTNAQIGSAIIGSLANSLDQITSQTSGGKMHFRGMVNEPATVTVGGNPATVDAAGNFDGTANVNIGTNTVAVVATDASGNNRSNNYQINVPSGTSRALLYDLNGNLINDGSKSYEWDAVNRLVAINYSGTTNRSEFTYDGLSRRVRIVEKSNSTIASTKNFVWIGQDVAEERDASNSVTKRYYRQGFNVIAQSSTSSYFYTRDHLDSIREATDSNRTIQARYDYDPYGQRTKVSGTRDADFGYTGHYCHQPSGLHLALYRAYSADLGRWISRDPKANSEFSKDGPNLYMYVGNSPEDRFDPLGLASADPRPPPSPTPGPVTAPLRPPGPTPGPPPAPPPSTICNCGPKPGALPQDKVCSSPAGILNLNRCSKQCCAEHDACYTAGGCRMNSWYPSNWGCWPECDKCNLTVGICVAVAVQSPFCLIP